MFAFAQDTLLSKANHEYMIWDHISMKGTTLLKHYWEDRATGNVAHASTYMDRHFQSIYYFGALDKSGELNVIQNLNLTNYSLSRMVETRHDDLMILTYIAFVDETLNGQEIQHQESPCMTIWKHIDGRWKLMSHSELTTPHVVS
jgi:hypothetical protein